MIYNLQNEKETVLHNVKKTYETPALEYMTLIADIITSSSDTPIIEGDGFLE